MTSSTFGEASGRSTSISVPAGFPRLGVGPHRGLRSGSASGSCLMEYVSVLAGERFSDLPGCTHPAVAALAWKINDEVGALARQQLLRRAPVLVGAGRGLDLPVRPIVLGTIAAAGRALDPQHRYFHRLQRRLDNRSLVRQQRATGDGHGAEAIERAGTAGTGGRLATWLHHLVPVNWATTQFMMTANSYEPDRYQRDQLALRLLDDCLAAVHLSAAHQPPTTVPALVLALHARP